MGVDDEDDNEDDENEDEVDADMRIGIFGDWESGHVLQRPQQQQHVSNGRLQKDE